MRKDIDLAKVYVVTIKVSSEFPDDTHYFEYGPTLVSMLRKGKNMTVVCEAENHGEAVALAMSVGTGWYGMYPSGKIECYRRVDARNVLIFSEDGKLVFDPRAKKKGRRR